MLQNIPDTRIRKKIAETIDRLSEAPDKQGKQLVAELSGLRSIRAVGQRYRIIYKIIKDEVVVAVIAAGIRKDGDRGDIYQLAKKLIRLRLIE
ncbi:MAG: type II toxin-antitoxin system RelE/ParE family toxin [Nitrospira sp.]|nr:type II toxin-antitoxin system RelE/ParE family toxin [Nitrospira sp.]